MRRRIGRAKTNGDSAVEDAPTSAAQCRERARKCFERAIVEESLTSREWFLRTGEAWMLRWREWPAHDHRGSSRAGPA